MDDRKIPDKRSAFNRDEFYKICGSVFKLLQLAAVIIAPIEGYWLYTTHEAEPNLQCAVSPVISVFDENASPKINIRIGNNTTDQLYLQRVDLTNAGIGLKNLVIEYRFEKDKNNDFEILSSTYNTAPTQFIFDSKKIDKYLWKYSINQFNPSDGVSITFLINRNNKIYSVMPRADDFDTTKYWHIQYLKENYIHK